MSIIFLISAIMFSFFLNVILLRLTKNFGVASRQVNTGVRWGSTSKPTTGGIAFYITFLLGTIILLLINTSVLNQETTKNYLALFASGTLAFFIGLADDAFNTRPGMKFIGQVICGIILIAFGIQIRYFDIQILDWGLTIFWVVAMMNSLNMLDNMDAVTTTVSLSIICITLGMSVTVICPFNIYYILIIIAGSFIGFLYLNWRPSKVYMGDTGSMFVGLVLAYTGIVFFWNIKTTPDNVDFVRKGLIPFMTFMVPILDTSFVTVARLRRGVSPFQGGRDHTTHHLVHIGVPENMVPVVLGTLSLVSGGMALLAYNLIPNWTTAYTVIFTLYPVIVFSVFIYLYQKGLKIGKIKDLLASREKMRLQRIAEKHNLQPPK
ncbi:MAG: undecaprenyl/decaprenyl-phosphate alpha-N-acetylglucosaminyl 1-phosphate transferase [Bacteroidia bacterium]|nr:undecaprenyl/decaprenyl-phosphate alpha-N-acetylglucosaminyl 1-phosphate transferase [Bacteroidia bacterium]